MSRVKDLLEQPKAKPEKVTYPQCEWVAGDLRCRYPGSMSSATNGAGPWYCRAHYGCADPRLGAQIVDASGDYTWTPIRERYVRAA